MNIFYLAEIQSNVFPSVHLFSFLRIWLSGNNKRTRSDPYQVSKLGQINITLTMTHDVLYSSLSVSKKLSQNVKKKLRTAHDSVACRAIFSSSNYKLLFSVWRCQSAEEFCSILLCNAVSVHWGVFNAQLSEDPNTALRSGWGLDFDWISFIQFGFAAVFGIIVSLHSLALR